MIIREEPIAKERCELNALIRSLQLAEGFTLLFACCDQRGQRQRLIAEAKAGLPQLAIQEIDFTRQLITHLLNAIRPRIHEPAPDAIFVSGLEFSFPEADTAAETVFIASLDMMRDSFGRELFCPLVLWLPEYVITAMFHGAFAFLAVRSGIFYFPNLDRSYLPVRLPIADLFYPVRGMPFEEKQERAAVLSGLLADYEALPVAQRDYCSESRLLSRLGELHWTLAHYTGAETSYKRAWERQQMASGKRGKEAAAIQVGLARIYVAQRRYAEAETLLKQALILQEEAQASDHPDFALTLCSLADLYCRKRHLRGDASELYRRARGIWSRIQTSDSLITMRKALLNVDRKYARGLYTPTHILYAQRDILLANPEMSDHPDMATCLFNCAGACCEEGRYLEAEAYLQRSLSMLEKAFGREHPELLLPLQRYADLLETIGDVAESVVLKARTTAIQEKINQYAAHEGDHLL